MLQPAHPLVRRLVRLAGVLLCAVGAGLASSCERPGDNSRIRLELWTLALRPFFDGYMHERVKAFEDVYLGLWVDWIDVPYDALDRKLIAAAAADRAPDVVNMADLNFARFAALGAFASLDNLTPGQAQDRFLPGSLGMCRLDGKLLALPWYVNPQARIVNTALLAEGGITTDGLADSWRGLVGQSKAFHDRTGKYLFTQPLGEESQLPIMLLAEGLIPFRERKDGRLTPALATPQIEEFIGLFVDLYRTGAMPRDAATQGHAHLTEMYQNRRVAVINTGPNFVKRIRDVAPTVYSSTEVRPGIVGALGRVHMPVMVMSVTSQSRHPREAAELAWFITSPESQLGLCRLSAVMPSTHESLKDPFFQAPDAGDDSRLAQARRVAADTVSEAVAFTPALECWPDLRRAFDERMKRVLIDGQDLHAALLEVEREWAKSLDASAAVGLDAIPRPSPLNSAGGTTP